MKRHWSRPLLAGTLALTLLAIPAQAIQTGEGFLRGDAMFICYEALDACPKGRGSRVSSGRRTIATAPSTTAIRP